MVMIWKMPASRMMSRPSCERIPLSRHHGGRHGAGVAAADAQADACRKIVAGAVEGHSPGFDQPQAVGRFGPPDRAERRANRADPGEIGVSGEVVAARQGRAGRGEQSGRDGDEIARRERVVTPGRQSHATRRVSGVEAAAVLDMKQEAGALLPVVHRFDEPGQLDDADPVEHRCREGSRAQFGGDEAKTQRSAAAGQAKRQGLVSQQKRHRDACQGKQDRKPEHGLATAAK